MVDRSLYWFKSNVGECEGGKNLLFLCRLEMLMRPKVCPLKRLMAMWTRQGWHFGNMDAWMATALGRDPDLDVIKIWAMITALSRSWGCLQCLHLHTLSNRECQDELSVCTKNTFKGHKSRKLFNFWRHSRDTTLEFWYPSLLLAFVLINCLRWSHYLLAST